MDSQSLARRMLQANAEAFDAGEYEAAFHILMAAMHLAADGNDDDLLQVICAKAKKHQLAIDAIQPPHRLSSTESARRGNPPLFETLQLHVGALKSRHKSRHARQ